MADNKSKLDVHYEKVPSSAKPPPPDKLILSYTFTPGDPLDKDPTFAVTQTLGWKDAKGDPKSAVAMRVMDHPDDQPPERGKVIKKGGTYSFTFELDADVTDVVVKTYKDEVKSLDDPTIQEDEDQIRLGKNLFNNKTATVLKVVGGKVEPNIVDFSAVSTGKTGITYKLTSIEGSYKDNGGQFARDIINKVDPNTQKKVNQFSRGCTFALKWTVEGLASDTKVELAIDPIDFAGKTKDNPDPKKSIVPPESPPDNGHVLDDPKNNPRDLTPSGNKDVDWTGADGTGTAVFRDQGNYSFYCDLRLKDGSGKLLKSQTICAAVDLPLPELSSFTLSDKAITPDTKLLGVQVTTAHDAKAYSLWMAVTKSDGTLVDRVQIALHNVDKDSIDQSYDIDPSKYPLDEVLTVRLGMFHPTEANGGPGGKDGSSQYSPDPWKIPDEGGLYVVSAPQQLKVSWSADKTAGLWLTVPSGSPDKWQWQVFGKADNDAMAGSGFFGPAFKVPFTQLRNVSGGMRVNLDGGGDGPNQEVDRGFKDKGHYVVRTADKDGKPDESTLVVAGQFGPDQPDVLRRIPGIGEDNLAVTVTKWSDDRAGKGFSSVKHFFVLMLENRSFDHMFGHIFKEADGTLNPDGSERSDCYSYACEILPNNANVRQTTEKVYASAGAPDQMIIDPGHEFSNVHFGLYGWADKGPADRSDKPGMHGFIGPYLNRLIPRTSDQGQWDGDAMASHNFRFGTGMGNWAVALAVGGLVVPTLLPEAAYASFKTKDTIKEALGSADLIAVSKSVMLGFTSRDVPVISGLAQKYALCDRWFSALPGPTWPNRLFVHSGTSGGLDDSPGAVDSAWKAKLGSYHLPHNIYDVMADNGCEWMIFAAGSNAQADTISITSKHYGAGDAYTRRVVTGDTNFKQLEQFIDTYTHITKGSFTFLEPDYGDLGINAAAQNNLAAAFLHGNSQHPISGARSGDDLIARVVQILKKNSEVWNSCALIVTHDEHGGFYDHVPPPNATPPGDTDQYSNVQSNAGHAGKRTTDGLTGAFGFGRYGVRVPAVVISPRIPSGVIDHTVYDHTSVLRTVRKAFGIGAPFSNREANANDFSHLFTLTSPRTD